MNGNPARTYRQLSAQGASPVGVVIQAYDQVVSALGGAIRALEARDIESKTRELDHALSLINHLQAMLDPKASVEVAKALEGFYNVARAQILAASAGLSTDILRQMVGQFISMREAWEGVEKSGSRPIGIADTVRPGPSGQLVSTQPSARWSA